MSEVGKKFDGGKLRYDLIPYIALYWLSRILTFGAVKYGENNWQLVENWRARYYAAAMRHLEQWRAGIHLDEESKMPHLAHALTCIVFLLCLEHGAEETKTASQEKES